MLQAPPLSIYVHMPWCVRKCPYCDFNSHVAPTQLPEARYVSALLEDLEFDQQWSSGALAHRGVESIFFGGGTPSLISPEQIAQVLNGIAARIDVAADVEVTLEANPGTIEHGRFTGYRAAGVNRVSLGVQSFNLAHLQLLGRIHNTEQVYTAVDELRSAGFDNFNLDLMYGLPDQSIEQALQDLEAAVALQPAHISHYQLTLEPGTVFYHRPPATLPDEEVLWQMQDQCQQFLAAHGYEHYEVSAYAQAGRQCRHNRNYWEFGDYIGLGAGAHGKISDQSTQTLWRTARQKQPREYLAVAAADRLVEHRTLKASELPFEFALNALRLRDGVASRLFESRTGQPIDQIARAVAAAEARGLLASRAGRFCASELGWRFLNDLQMLFLDSG
jgi:putative oxygen-independent coproporphyrinogen III oxidase